MSNKFTDFLTAKKIDTRRIIATSQNLEKLRREDRATKLKARLSENKKRPADAAKPRSGRPVTIVLLEKIAAGKAVPGAAKTRVLRAVNILLEQKKEAPAQIKDLF
jgi:hypothetical protein